MCKAITADLNLYSPSSISNQSLIANAQNIESLSLKQNSPIKTSDGAAISCELHNFILANTNGFNLGYKTSRYSKHISLIGESKDGLQTDYWYDVTRDFNDLISDEELAATAVTRTKRRLHKGRLKAAKKYPVIFEAAIAKSLISTYLNAVSGSNLFRRLSFLNDSLGQQIFPEWVNIEEDPYITKGIASGYFDNEGVTVIKRSLVNNGQVNGYLLGCYSARKMELISTGNAGGCHNILVTPNFSGDLLTLAKTMGSGLIIIETIGHGVNMVTGDYSVGASGLWVENGSIQFFVDNLTISGNLRQIFADIVHIGDDYSPHEQIQCGSILVDGINVSL